MKTVQSDWADTILVCKKCTKKLGGGFGLNGRTPLAKALRQALSVRKGRKGALGIVEVKCLGLCPKGAVTVVNGRVPGAWLLKRCARGYLGDFRERPVRSTSERQVQHIRGV